MDDLFAPAIKAARPAGRFKPKPKPPVNNKPPASVSTANLITNNDSTSKSPARVNDSTIDVIDKANASSHPNLDDHAQNADTFIRPESINDSTTAEMDGEKQHDVPRSDIPIPENTGGGSDVPTNNISQDPIQVWDDGDLITASWFDSGVSANDKECEREEMEMSADAVHSSVVTTAPVQRTEKIQPKRNVQMQKEAPAISGMESAPNPLEINSSEHPLNEESVNIMVDVPGTSEAYVASNDSGQQQNACSSGQDNGTTGRVLWPRKRKITSCEQDEAEDHQTTAFSDKHPADEDANCDDEQVEQVSESKVKRKRQKSTKTDEDKEKQSKKQKKAKKAPDVKPKKFSRSTQRRQASKYWLEKDEIDYELVSLKELIWLAEHREKETNKEEATEQPAIKPSNGNSSASHYENETYEYGEDQEEEGEEEDNNKQEPEAEVKDMDIFNYHTYMNKTPTIRWSKQDTELFYEAVRQFGTDLSMIQHLFPGRTRHQIKLKYKKEEKQNPFRLHDALTIRTKDVSHFQKVIDRLKEIAAEQKQNDDEDEPMGFSGDEVEEQEPVVANDEGVKVEEIVKEKKEEDVAQEPVNPEEHEDDEEDDIWSNYKSIA